MNKSELVRMVSNQVDLTQAQTREVLDAILDLVKEALANEDRVEFRNWGTFELKQQAPRTVRNPRSGEPTEVPLRYKVKFRPGKEIQERLSLRADAEVRRSSADSESP